MTTNLPAAFAAGPSQKFQGLSRASLAEGIGQSYAVIGYRGKTWSLRYRGDEYNILRSDGTPSAIIDVVILRSAPTKSKSYYEKYVMGQSEGKPPLCSSIDGVLPDEGVTAKQADSCALCPRNEWKTRGDGGKGRECSDYKRLAVLIMPEFTGPVLNGVPLIEPVFLRVPAASLNDLAKFGEEMDAKGYDFSSFITRIKFDPDKSHPQFMFEAVRPLSDPEADTVLPLVADKQSLRVTGEDQQGTRPALAPPAQTQAPQLAAPIPTQPVSVPASAPVAAQPSPPPQVQPTPAKVYTLGGPPPAAQPVPTQPAPPPPAAQVQQVAADTVVTAPTDLDARVKALLAP